MPAHAGIRSGVRPCAGPAGIVVALLVTVGTGTTVAVTAIARNDPRAALAWREPIWFGLAELVTAAVVIAAAWAARARPAAAVGMGVAAAGVLLPLCAGWWWLPAQVRAGVSAAEPLVVAGVTLMAVSWTNKRIRLCREVVAHLLASVAIAAHLLGYNPLQDPGCLRSCDDVDPLLHNALTTSATISLTTALTIGSAAAALGTVVHRDLGRSILMGAIAAILLLAVSSAFRWLDWADPDPPLVLLLLPPFAVTLIGVALCFEVLQTWRIRAAVRHLVTSLSGSGSPGGFRGAIRGVHFALPDGAGWIDEDGAAVDIAAEEKTVVLSDASGPAVRLLVSGTTDSEAVRAGLAPATQLALRNAQLTAVATAQVAAVRESQRRIVAATDGERRRIERDLHDGAQQRLVSVAIQLQLALADADSSTTAKLLLAETWVRDGLMHLRGLAHGVVLGALADEGLETALEDLVAGSDVPATLNVRAVGPVPSEVAAAVYVTLAAALRSVAVPLAQTLVDMSVVRGEGDLTVGARITSGGASVRPDFTEAADRVGAADGQFTVFRTSETDLIVTAVMPCVS